MSAVHGDTIGRYLMERLRAHGVGHVFGVPGDYVRPSARPFPGSAPPGSR